MLMVEMDAKPVHLLEKLLAQKMDQQDQPLLQTVQVDKDNNSELALKHLEDQVEVEDKPIHGINHQVNHQDNKTKLKLKLKQLNQKAATLTSLLLPVELLSKTPMDASLVTSLGYRCFSESFECQFIII